METANKYAGTMFSHCDTTLTDIMLSADRLVKKVEYLLDNLNDTVLESYTTMFAELDRSLVEKCVTPTLHLMHENCSSAKEQFRSLLFHIKHVFREIYTAWVAGTPGYAPVFAQCVNEIDNRISCVDNFRWTLSNMK